MEGNKTVVLGLASPTGVITLDPERNDSQVTITIVDDDCESVSFLYSHWIKMISLNSSRPIDDTPSTLGRAKNTCTQTCNVELSQSTEWGCQYHG